MKNLWAKSAVEDEYPAQKIVVKINYYYYYYYYRELESEIFMYI